MMLSTNPILSALSNLIFIHTHIIQDSNRQKAMQCLAQGRTSEAFQYFSKAVDVSPAMAHRWIRTIKGVPNVSYVVAPYEV